MTLTFQECGEMMQRCRSDEKHLPGRCYSTSLCRLDNHTYAIRYHRTYVVKIHDDGSYTINNGGYNTVTTKARINEYSPARITQKDFAWYFDGWTPFEGIHRVDGDGKVIEDLRKYHQQIGYKEPPCYAR